MGLLQREGGNANEKQNPLVPRVVRHPRVVVRIILLLLAATLAPCQTVALLARRPIATGTVSRYVAAVAVAATSVRQDPAFTRGQHPGIP